MCTEAVKAAKAPWDGAGLNMGALEDGSQWIDVYKRQLGMTYLFSLNRKRSDADLVITASSGRSLVWQGRVMTKKRYPLPGR